MYKSLDNNEEIYFPQIESQFDFQCDLESNKDDLFNEQPQMNFDFQQQTELQFNTDETSKDNLNEESQFDLQEISLTPKKKQNSHNSRRRNQKFKKEEKLFKCGDKNCKKEYGTNGALYIHIKNIHDNIEPEGTQRPDTIKSLKGRPLQGEIQNRIEYKLEKKRPITNEEEKRKIIRIYANSSYIDLVHAIGMYGECDQINIFLRDIEEPINPLNKEDLEAISKQISDEFHEEYIELSEKNIQLLRKASYSWKQKVQQELAYVLLYSLYFKGTNTTNLINKIQFNVEEFKTFFHLYEKKNQNTFDQFTNTVYKSLIY